MEHTINAPTTPPVLRAFSEEALLIFAQAIDDYHRLDSTDAPYDNPYTDGTIEHLLYHKCWIDSVQWHVEDEIRAPAIHPARALGLKRRIDRLNQERTDRVEGIDDYFLSFFSDAHPASGARINTESPAWAVDRLSILALKIYHMEAETSRTDAPAEHQQRCRGKLAVLLEQRHDLALSINELLHDIGTGRRRMKVYRQMKMYNDESLNPVLYKASKVN